MKSKQWLALFLVLLPVFLIHVFAQEDRQWKIAAPGYHYEFPRDHFNHPDFQTEWWYYTGNLRSHDGHRFGFELTFFRTGIHLPERIAEQSDAVWRPDQIYLAHLALSDIDSQHFFHSERLNRAGPGLAGCSIEDRQDWNGNWRVSWKSLSSDGQTLRAVAPQFTLRLDLQPLKPPVIQGQNGVSQKGPEPSQASHYISFTRIRAQGTLSLNHSDLQVDGTAWMDHEFFSEPRNTDLGGWDWFAVQLENNQELMLYRLRRKSGAPDPYSSGSFVDAQGHAHFLNADQFALKPGGVWQSPHSKARYPLAWQIDVPSLRLHLQQKTALSDQELFSRSAVTPSYWEGAVTYSGEEGGTSVRGIGYVEMTGYDKPVWLRQH